MKTTGITDAAREMRASFTRTCTETTLKLATAVEGTVTPLCSTTFDPPIEQVLASFTTAGFQGEQLLDQRILGAFTARAENAEAAVVFSVARTFDTEAGIAISNCLMMVQAPRM
jgi:hypothetical protein